MYTNLEKMWGEVQQLKGQYLKNPLPYLNDDNFTFGLLSNQEFFDRFTLEKVKPRSYTNTALVHVLYDSWTSLRRTDFVLMVERCHMDAVCNTVEAAHNEYEHNALFYQSIPISFETLIKIFVALRGYTVFAEYDSSSFRQVAP